MSMDSPPPYVTTNQHSAGMANAGHGVSGRRIRGAENLAELKAMRRRSRSPFLRRLLNLVSRRKG